MRYEILDGETVTNTIIADADYMEANYQQGNYREVPEPPAPEPEPPVWEWYIDIGPFFDRFGATKMAVLTSADAGVRALITDLQVRKWVDLQLAEVAQGLAYIGTVVPSVTPALQQTILTTPVLETENLALRKLYFS